VQYNILVTESLVKLYNLCKWHCDYCRSNRGTGTNKTDHYHPLHPPYSECPVRKMPHA